MLLHEVKRVLRSATLRPNLSRILGPLASWLVQGTSRRYLHIQRTKRLLLQLNVLGRKASFVATIAFP